MENGTFLWAAKEKKRINKISVPHTVLVTGTLMQDY